MGLFSGRRSTETHNTAPVNNGVNGNGAYRNSTSPVGNNGVVGNNHSHRGGMIRNGEDVSITSARERVLQAEAAEREADRALVQSRAAVRDAREHVKRLEREAAEEARLAKVKQTQARNISRRAKPLGRHERY